MDISNLKRKIAELKSLPFKINSVVLYGSFARHTQTPDSDIDLLFVSDEITPKRHKRGRDITAIKAVFSLGVPMEILLLTPEECISNFKNHNPLFLDIAWEGIILYDENDFLKNLIDETKNYISTRNITKLKDGWMFPVPERVSVFLSNVSTRDFAFAMLTDGERDFAVGVKIMENGYFDKAVYHFQQSVEKAVKAVLISFGIYKKTHFVGEILLKELEKRTLDENWKEQLSYISKISTEIEPEVTWSRYPGINEDSLWIPAEEYSADDADTIKQKCGRCLKTTQDFLGWWFQ